MSKRDLNDFMDNDNIEKFEEKSWFLFYLSLPIILLSIQ